MSFDPGFLILDLAIGGVGFVLFVYGRKQQRWPQMAAGVAFMVYPYFVSTVGAMLVVGGIIAAGLWWSVRAGY